VGFSFPGPVHPGRRPSPRPGFSGPVAREGDGVVCGAETTFANKHRPLFHGNPDHLAYIDLYQYLPVQTSTKRLVPCYGINRFVRVGPNPRFKGPRAHYGCLSLPPSVNQDILNLSILSLNLYKFWGVLNMSKIA
jgi:hypothetical protein